MYFPIVVSTLAACVIALDGVSFTPRSSGFSQEKRENTHAFNHTVKHFACGTDTSHATDHFMSTVYSLHHSDLKAGASPGAAAAAHAVRVARTANTQINVPLYIHVVTTQANDKMVTPAQVTQQFNTLNAVYQPYGVQFTLKNTSWTINDTWAVGSSAADDASMKTALRQGTYSSLNLYFQSDLAGGVLGKCTLPTNVGNKPPASVYISDGCNIALGTMPNGPIQGYNMGKTAVHETGHWLGLLHTFEGYSCTGNGDFITDTPAESQSTNGCPTNPWKNSCAGSRSGVDPIHNYMDYSIDSCYTKFTPGQQTRIQTLWKQYRAGN